MSEHKAEQAKKVGEKAENSLIREKDRGPYSEMLHPYNPERLYLPRK